jgi:replication factor C subunit 3/5
MSIVFKITRIDSSLNVIIQGPVGIGKNSILNCLENKIKRNKKKILILSVNGQNEFQISKLKEKLLNFKMNSFNIGTFSKVVLIKNPDLIPNGSQLILRENMEEGNQKINFLLLSNSFYNINPAIYSRCIPVIFKLIPEIYSIVKLKEILEKEKLELTIEFITEIVKIGNGDIRKTINLLFSKFNNKEDKRNNFSLDLTTDLHLKSIDIFLKENKLEIFEKITKLSAVEYQYFTKIFFLSRKKGNINIKFL